jgi:MFS family permease
LVGDRVGFRPVLVIGLAGGAVALVVSPFAPSIGLLAVATLAFVAFNGIVGPMVFALLATEVPAERRSPTLNLVYLPLYAAGIVGPAIGAAMASSVGVGAAFLAGSIVLAVGAAGIAVAMRSRRPAA